MDQTSPTVIATDSISAFDTSWVGSGKGKVLTQLSAFGSSDGRHRPHHVMPPPCAIPAVLQPHADTCAADRCCAGARGFPRECVARGYLSGYGWKV